MEGFYVNVLRSMIGYVAQVSWRTAHQSQLQQRTEAETVVVEEAIHKATTSGAAKASPCITILNEVSLPKTKLDHLCKGDQKPLRVVLTESWPTGMA